MNHRVFLIIKNGTDSFKELFIIYVGLIILAAGGFAIAEHTDFFGSLYWAITTALTIGYGDIVPTTVAGRFIAVVLIHSVTLFIIPLIVARYAVKMIDNRDVFTHEEQEEIKTLLKKIANDKG